MVECIYGGGDLKYGCGCSYSGSNRMDTTRLTKYAVTLYIANFSNGNKESVLPTRSNIIRKPSAMYEYIAKNEKLSTKLF